MLNDIIIYNILKNLVIEDIIKFHRITQFSPDNCIWYERTISEAELSNSDIAYVINRKCVKAITIHENCNDILQSIY
jgi:hypothetical protein